MNASIPQTATTLADMQAIWVAPLKDGTLCVVSDGFTKAILYRLSKTSGAVPSGSTVVAPIAGAPIAGAAGARWLLCCPDLPQ